MSVPSISAFTAGDLLQGRDRRLHEEAHEAELHAVTLLEGVLVLVAQRHDVAHVDLVEGRQHGGGVLRLLQTAGDGLAQARHAHALFARAVLARARLRRGRRLRRLGGERGSTGRRGRRPW
jgi:hypothetical protein